MPKIEMYPYNYLNPILFMQVDVDYCDKEWRKFLDTYMFKLPKVKNARNVK